MRIGICISQSSKFGCTKEMTQLVAMLSVDNVFYLPQEKKAEALAAKRRFVSSFGDHITLLNVFRAAQRTSKESGGKNGLNKHWCQQNFMNARYVRDDLLLLCLNE